MSAAGTWRRSTALRASHSSFGSSFRGIALRRPHRSRSAVRRDTAGGCRSSEGSRAPGRDDAEQIQRIGARERDVAAGVRPAARLAQQRHGLGRGVLLAREAGDEAAAANLAARLQAAAAHQDVAPRRQPRRLARQQPPENHAPAPQQRAHHVLDGLLAGPLRTAAQRGGARAPSARHRPWRTARCGACAGRRGPTLGRAGRPAPAARAGRRSCRSSPAERHELGERLLRFGRQHADAVGDLVEERGAVRP